MHVFLGNSKDNTVIKGMYNPEPLDQFFQIQEITEKLHDTTLSHWIINSIKR